MQSPAVIFLAAAMLAACSTRNEPVQAPTGVTASGGGGTEYLAKTPDGGGGASGGLVTTRIR